MHKLKKCIGIYSEQDEANEVLRNLSSIVIPQMVSFSQMTKLIQQCELLDKMQHEKLSTTTSNSVNKDNYGMSNVLSLLSGILPGS